MCEMEIMSAVEGVPIPLMSKRDYIFLEFSLYY